MRGAISAVNEVDLHNQLHAAGLELVQCRAISKKSGGRFSAAFNKVKLRDQIQFFINMEQMESAGVPMLDALSDIRDGSENDQMRDIVGEIHRDVRDGAALSEAMAKHPKIFKPLYISLIKAGEENGDMPSSYKQLETYLKWVDAMNSKIKKATRYPMIVSVVVLFTVWFMMSQVVPQIVGFLKYLDVELPWFTIWLIATSNFFVEPQFNVFGVPIYGGIIFFGVPILLAVSYIMLRRSSEFIAYKMDAIWLVTPVIGNIIRKITIARYAQTFSSLFSSGIDVLKSLDAARGTVSNLVLIDAMKGVEQYVKSGSPLSDALNASGEFPSMVVRMLKIGEGSGNLSPVLSQVSEFYTKDVDEAIDGLIELIQPVLTLILALIIVWIAAGSLGPIYMNLGTITD